MNILRQRHDKKPFSDDELHTKIIREGTLEYLRRTPPLTEGALVAGGMRRATAARRVRRDTKLRERYAAELA